MSSLIKTRSWLMLQLLCLLVAPSAWAHVGSPDVYVEAKAGAYPLFVTVRPPAVLPGVAEVFVRSEAPGTLEITAAPTPMTGDAAKHPPTPDLLKKEADGTYTGSLWIMATGSWQVRLHVRGVSGEGTVSIPLPSTSTSVRTMSVAMGLGLAATGVLLLLGMVGIAGAGVRDAVLPPGSLPDPARRTRGRRAALVTLALLIAATVFGNRWWNVEAAAYGRSVYKPLVMTTSRNGDGDILLKLRDPGWLLQRRLDDLIPDHGHLVHLYAIRWPAMDAVYHLHPEMAGVGDFRLRTPAVEPGQYRLFADIVHATGFPETAIADVTLDGAGAPPLAGDDAGTNRLSAIDKAGAHATEIHFADGYFLRFMRPAHVVTREGIPLRFALFDASGKPAADMTRYMGMPGHAAILKSDGSVFAHIHPEGSVAMAAYMMANPEMSMDAAGTPPISTDSMRARAGRTSSEVTFPYGFPTSGRYRIVVQVKHAATVETGAFDVDVE